MVPGAPRNHPVANDPQQPASRRASTAPPGREGGGCMRQEKFEGERGGDLEEERSFLRNGEAIVGVAREGNPAATITEGPL
jgi:hypothetical protein